MTNLYREIVPEPEDELPEPRRGHSSSLGGSIRKRITKYGETRYDAVVPTGRFRRAPRISRTAKTRVEALALLDDLQARIIKTLASEQPREMRTLSHGIRHQPNTSFSDVDQQWSSVVYFVRMPGGFIKIGTTKRLVTRLRSFLAVTDDITLLAHEPGGVQREWQLHAQFMSSRIGDTERFVPSDDLLAYIAVLNEAR